MNEPVKDPDPYRWSDYEKQYFKPIKCHEKIDPESLPNIPAGKDKSWRKRIK